MDGKEGNESGGESERESDAFTSAPAFASYPPTRFWKTVVGYGLWIHSAVIRLFLALIKGVI